MTKLIQMLKQVAPLTEKDCEDLMNITWSIQLQKGDIWIEAGKKTDLFAFVDEGYLRRFYNLDGNEVTSFFYFENDVCADLPSMIGNPLPQESIVAMETTTLTYFSYTEFKALCKSIPAFEQLHRFIFQMTFLRFYNKTMAAQLKSAHARYQDLAAANSRILQDVAPEHMASYLGLTSEQFAFLS